MTRVAYASSKRSHRFIDFVRVLLLSGCLAFLASLAISDSARAETVDWTTVERAGGGMGWDDAGATNVQSFVNLDGSGVGMDVSYSDNMRDGLPNIYGVDAPVPPLQTSLRWTNNPADAGGAPGAADGPALFQITFSQPILVDGFTVSSLSRIDNPTRYEWIQVRAYDAGDQLVAAGSLTPSTYAPDGTLTTRTDSPQITEPTSRTYRARGTSVQGSCDTFCGYDRMTNSFTALPVQRIELVHFVTVDQTAESGISGQAASVAIEGFSFSIPTYDYGDLPESGAPSYATTIAGNGPSHLVRDNLYMGDSIDAENDGQPTVEANGDDVNPAIGPDDEDGVETADLALAEGAVATIRVRATNRSVEDATLYGWIDVDANGILDVFERTQADVPAGAENETITLNFGVIPVNGVTNTFARFRLSTDPAAGSPTRPALNGEVEDYPVTITLAPEFDWGDAPDSFATDANDSGEGIGPSHVLSNEGMRIGAAVDPEDDGRPGANADGDDLDPPAGPDDEDGVRTADLAIVETRPALVRVSVSNLASEPARLYGWIDFNRNGQFEPFERSQADVPAGSTDLLVLLDFGNAPDTGLSTASNSFARFRLSSDAAAAMPTGPAGDGEVEDYAVVISPRPLVEAPRPRFTTLYAAGTPAVYERSAEPAGPGESMPQSPDDRTPDIVEGFETGSIDPAVWTVVNEGAGPDRGWGVDDSRARRGTKSVWMASGGQDGLTPATSPTPPNLNTWLTLAKPLDLTNVKSADLEFWLHIDSEPQADTIFVGVSLDNKTFDGATWFGDSGGWTYFNMDLKDYLGYPEVYVAWVFVSNDEDQLYASGVGTPADTVYEGVWIDDVAVWTYLSTDPSDATESVQNGDFEDGIADWTVGSETSVEIIEATSPISGTSVAVLGGTSNAQDILYQSIYLDDKADANVSLTFWLNLFGEETELDADEICVRLYGEVGGVLDLSNKLADLGCFDGAEATSAAPISNGWRHVEFLFPAELWDKVRGSSVFVLFDVHTNEIHDTTVYLDGVSIEIVTDGTPGDRFESNDFVRIATPVGGEGGPVLGEKVSDLSIDPKYDVDYFSLSANAGDRIRVDVDAKSIGSPLDAKIAVLNSDQVLLCEGDDDGATSDPFVICQAPSVGTYYVEITAFDENGGRDHVYAVDIQVLPPEVDPPGPPVAPPPVAPEPAATWTAMIYLAGDTNLCLDYDNDKFSIIRGLENDLAGKIGEGGFLNVVVLFDRNVKDGKCATGGTTRYHIQQDGNYVVGISLWNQDQDLNTGDKNTLVDFVTRAMRQFPADHYYLAIENHGNAVQGVAEDWSSLNRGKRERLDTRELYSALKEITDSVNRKFDILAYEACLMGAYEIAYDVRNFTDSIFFFPTASYTNKLSYPAYLSNPAFTDKSTGGDLGDIMFDTYRQGVLGSAYVMTLADTGGVTALHEAVNAWADVLLRSIQESPANAEQLRQARSQAQKINSQNTLRGATDGSLGQRLTDEDHYLDLYDLAAKVAELGIAVDESNAVMAAVDVVVRRSYNASRGALDYSNSHGLTIFWPKTCGSEYRRYVSDRIFTSTQEGTWDEFLGAYFASISEKKDEKACMAAEYVNLINRSPSQDPERFFLPSIMK